MDEAIYNNEDDIIARRGNKIFKYSEKLKAINLIKDSKAHTPNYEQFYGDQPLFKATNSGNIFYINDPIFFDTGETPVFAEKYTQVFHNYNEVKNKQIGNLTINNFERSSCDIALFNYFFNLSVGEEPLNYPENRKFTAIYRKNDLTYLIGTAGSGLLELTLK